MGSGLSGKQYENAYWSDGNLLSLDWGSGYMGVHTCQSLTNSTI